MIKLNFKSLEKGILLPSQKHESDAGYDVYSSENIILQPSKTTVISTKITMQMEWDFSPFEIGKETLPALLFQEQTVFATDFAYYNQEWIKQNYKFYAEIKSRSGLASKGIHAEGGIIDQEYTGELRIILANTGKASYKIQKGDRIAQIIPYIIPKITSINWVESFGNTNRGENGFGSSGK